MNDIEYSDMGQLNGALRPALSDQATIVQLEKRVAELEAALKPFAEFYRQFGGGGQYPTIFGDFRRASDLLNGDEGKR